MSELMTVDETATYLRVKVKTLHNWRSRRVGPPALKVVGALRYRRVDVDTWLTEQLAAEQDSRTSGLTRTATAIAPRRRAAAFP